MSTFSLLRPSPDAPPIQASADEVDQIYRYWRRRILTSSIAGYAAYYVVRVNIAVAVPVIHTTLGLSNEKLGLVMTLGGVTYGLSKFVNGFLGDRANPRFFMPLGLLCSAIMNLCFGLSAGATTFAVFWLLNGWFQGMGFPPCARNMSHWFAPAERSTSFGLWNMGHQIGGAMTSILCGYLVVHDWRWCFFIPAAIAIVMTFVLLERLRDTPESLGLPPVEVYRNEPIAAVREKIAEREDEQITHAQFVVRHVFRQKFVWIVSIANFFVYALRYSIFNWGPTFLIKTKGTALVNTGWLSAGSEFAGLFGAILGGWITDRYFAGRAGRVCTLATLAMAVAIFAFWQTPGSSRATYTALFIAMGFLIYIPQLLVAVIAMNISTKRAAATAVGLTGLFGYASSVLSGWGVGRLSDHYGWNAAFIFMLICCAVMCVLFLMTWNVGSQTGGDLISQESYAS